MKNAPKKSALTMLGALALAACSSGTTSTSTKSPTLKAAEVSRSSSAETASGTLASTGVNGEKHFSVYLTGYSYWDNTPPGSAEIARPVLRQKAGGTGSYKDPVTIAVGHAIYGSRQVLDYPAGTRFYFPRLRKYAIVEDVCGDGRTPQDGPCHTGHNGLPWLDIYVDGSRSAKGEAQSCASKLTRVQPVIQNPAAGYPVVAGRLTESGCQVF